MAVFRIERTRDYTVMSNHHLRNGKLSLKAKGLLSMMLSLPEDWNYTTRGLAAICKEGVDAIGGALRELETAGYIVRHQLRDRQGRISDTEYVIYEQPQPKNPDTPQPDTASPDTGNPDMENPDTEKPAELNIEKSNTQKSITDGSSTDSIPFRETAAARPPERKGRDAMSVSEIENYRELILENIEYDYLCREFATYREDLDEIVELMVETVCARRKTTRIAGSDFPHEVVRSRFLKLDSEHIRFVMDSLQKNTTEVRNMKQYLLTVLFNAPTTISNHYTSQVNHDMNAGGWYGTKYCHNSPTLDEEPLQRSILAAINSVMSQKSTLIRQITSAMEVELAPVPGESISLAAIEQRLDELNNLTRELVAEAARTKDAEAYTAQLREIMNEAAELKEKRAYIEEQRQNNTQAVQRIEDAAAAMEQAACHICEWDEALIRQLVDTVKVHSAEKITVYLRGGVQVDQDMI